MSFIELRYWHWDVLNFLLLNFCLKFISRGNEFNNWIYNVLCESEPVLLKNMKYIYTKKSNLAWTLPFLWQNHHCSCPYSWRASQCATPRPWTRQTWASGRNRGPSFWKSLQPRPWDCFLYFLFRVSLLHAIFSLLQRDSFCTNWIGEYTTGGWFEHEAMNKITISGTAKLLNCFWFYCKTSPLQELFHLTSPNWQGPTEICLIFFGRI